MARSHPLAAARFDGGVSAALPPRVSEDDSGPVGIGFESDRSLSGRRRGRTGIPIDE